MVGTDPLMANLLRWRSIVGFAHRVINPEEAVKELESTICL